jgi:peptidoglycan/LPS O-acetylase OafA/YrhL
LLTPSEVKSADAAPLSPKHREGRLPDLDGVRGIAILLVLVCHYIYTPELLVGKTPFFAHVFFFQICASGVDLFFTLSGFLIGGILLDHYSSPRFFSAFYGRRLFRIFPAYYAFLIVIGIQGIVLHSAGKPTPVFDAGTPYWMFFLFLQNFGLSWYADQGWTTVTMAWSLALEEQCYLTLPAAVRWLNKRALIAISLFFIMGAPVARFIFPEKGHTFGVLVLAAFHADALAAGFLCAMLTRSKFLISSRRLCQIASLFLILVLVTHIGALPLAFLRGSCLLALYSSVVLLAFRGYFALLRAAWLRFLGTISYSLYLIHQSLLVGTHHLLRHAVPSAVGIKALLTSAIALALAISLSWLSWRLFESHLLFWARRKYKY